MTARSRVVIALGGNAMTGPDGSATPAAQRKAIAVASGHVADVVAAGVPVKVHPTRRPTPAELPDLVTVLTNLGAALLVVDARDGIDVDLIADVTRYSRGTLGTKVTGLRYSAELETALDAGAARIGTAHPRGLLSGVATGRHAADRVADI